MKCCKCGNEIRVGSVFCEKCGEAAQIVPDYNVLEDDFLVSILDEKKKEQQKVLEETTTPSAKKIEKLPFWKNKKILCTILGCILILFLGIGVFLFQTSYSHYVNKGLALDEKEAYDEAVLYYEKAIAKDNSKSKAKLLAADDYLKLTEYEKAEIYYLEVLSQDKTSVAAYKGLLSLYVSLGDYTSIDTLREGVTNEKILAVFEETVIPAPAFSEKSDQYGDDITLSLEASSEYEILYSDDGTDPSKKSNGMLYQEPITLTEGTTTIKAVCRNRDGKYGQVISQKYKIVYEKPEVPEITPAGGSYTVPTTISIAVPEGGQVYYTWDDITPTENATLYTGPVEMMEGNHILSVILVDKHGMKSDVTQCNYKLVL